MIDLGICCRAPESGFNAEILSTKAAKCLAALHRTMGESSSHRSLYNYLNSRPASSPLASAVWLVKVNQTLEANHLVMVSSMVQLWSFVVC